LDAEGRTVVRAKDGAFTIPPAPDDWIGSDWSLHYLQVECGADLKLGAALTSLLGELLTDLEYLRPEPSDGLDLAALAEAYFKTRPTHRGIATGGSFAFDVPAETPAVWGTGEKALWAEGEGAMIFGPQGARKTTNALAVALGLIGAPGFDQLWDLPVKPLPEGEKVLYLALDRPRQIARALRRMVAQTPELRELMDERLIVWRGPLPVNVLKTPTALAAWATAQGATAVIIDSYKDVAGALSNEEVAAALNTAVQECLAEGIQVLILHHPRKANADNRKPDKLDDVHGSGNLTRGLGSVIVLWAQPGEPLVSMMHVKQPAEPVGPLALLHDEKTGRATVLKLETSPGKGGEREKAIIAKYMASGGVGTVFGLADFEEATFGSENSIRNALQLLTGRGLLEYREGGGSEKSTWTMIPPLGAGK
jgi:replicative DNA helicase